MCPSKNSGIPTGTVHKIFNLSCNPLTDLPEKNAYLRQYHAQFFIGSIATYDCMAGYTFPDGVSISLNFRSFYRKINSLIALSVSVSIINWSILIVARATSIRYNCVNDAKPFWHPEKKSK